MSQQTDLQATDQRVETLRRFDILDTHRESSFDDLALLASATLAAPTAAICFMDMGRNWVKASFGAELELLPTDFGVCKELLAEPPGSKRVAIAKLHPKSGQPDPIVGIPGAKIWAGAPIFSPDGEQLLGAVCIFDTEERKLTGFDEQSLLALSRQVTRLLDLKRVMTSLELATVKMEVLIDRDPTTGLPTDRVFRGHLRTEFQYARRHGQPLTLLLVKVQAIVPESRLNPSETTDEIFKKLARLLGRDTREYDLVARSGDSEFAIVMRNATSEIGARVAGRLRARIAGSEVMTASLPIQFAVSSLTPDMVSSHDMISRAQEVIGSAVPVAVA